MCKRPSISLLDDIGFLYPFQTSQQFLQMPSASNFGQIKPGETVQLGGQTYVAVPMGHSMFQKQYPSLPHPLNSLGLMPAANSQQQQQSIESQQQPQQQQQQQPPQQQQQQMLPMSNLPPSPIGKMPYGHQQQQELQLEQAHPQFSSYPQHSTSNQSIRSLPNFTYNTMDWQRDKWINLKLTEINL
jgi:hypothetical protein